jgi:hypothetical protein
VPFVPLNFATQASAGIQIDVSGRTLSCYVRGVLRYTFPCGVGKFSTPTPQGSWAIREKITNPSWEVLGSRWMGLSIPWGNYGIHGTNAPWTIGRYISNGCIRLLNQDVEAIFPLMSIGSPVNIVVAYPGAGGWTSGGSAWSGGAGGGATGAGEYTLTRGSTGPDVFKLQKRLGELGFDPGGMDGLFGPRTEQALMAFQRSKGLLPDGAVRRETRTALGI